MPLSRLSVSCLLNCMKIGLCCFMKVSLLDYLIMMYIKFDPFVFTIYSLIGDCDVITHYKTNYKPYPPPCNRMLSWCLNMIPGMISWKSCFLLNQEKITSCHLCLILVQLFEDLYPWLVVLVGLSVVQCIAFHPSFWVDILDFEVMALNIPDRSQFRRDRRFY